MPLHRKGLTLVELLIVVAILVVLAGVGIPAMQSFINKGRVSQTQTILIAINDAYSNYFNDYNRYPESSTSTSTADSDEVWNTVTDAEYIEIASGRSDLALGQNTQGKDYLAAIPSTSEQNKPGLHATSNTIYSGFGTELMVRFDSNFDDSMVTAPALDGPALVDAQAIKVLSWDAANEVYSWSQNRVRSGKASSEDDTDAGS